MSPLQENSAARNTKMYTILNNRLCQLSKVYYHFAKNMSKDVNFILKLCSIQKNGPLVFI